MTKTIAALALFGALAFALFGLTLTPDPTGGGPKWPKSIATIRGL